MNTENTVLDAGIDGDYFKPTTTNLATTGQRFANYLIDLVMVLIVIVLLAVILELLSFSIPDNDLIYRLLGVISMVIYYTLTEMSGGRTLGKLITKTKVVNELGETPKASQVLKRSLCRIVPFEAFSAFSSTKLMWHDKWSDTYTIKAN